MEFEACERSISILLLFFRGPPSPIYFRKFVIFMGVANFPFPFASGKANARGVRAFPFQEALLVLIVAAVSSPLGTVRIHIYIGRG